MDFLAEEVARLEASKLLRIPRFAPPGAINVCSNDYLGLGSLALPLGPGGSGASALVCGYAQVHRDAEQAIAQWLQVEGGLLFTSGYAANVGTIAALVGPEDLVLSDELNHASIIDGCRLSRANVRVFPHNDLATLRAILESSQEKFRRRLLVVEACFSMDGDFAPLAELRSLADEFDCVLMVDEAHTVGVIGPAGRGLGAANHVEADVLVIPLGKAFGLQGAFVGGRAPLKTYLWNFARSFVFSTGISPAIAAAIPDRVELLRNADAERAQLLNTANSWRQTLREAGAEVRGLGAITGWVLGAPAEALAAQDLLLHHGVWASAIRPPTVPPHTSRIRLTATTSITPAQQQQVEEALAAVAKSAVSHVSRETSSP